MVVVVILVVSLCAFKVSFQEINHNVTNFDAGHMTEAASQRRVYVQKSTVHHLHLSVTQLVRMYRSRE